MHIDTNVYVVWANRGARSMFGPASNPVMRNGRLLCFKTEDQARVAHDQLNARPGGAHMRYSVRLIHVQINRPDGLAQGDAAGRAAVPHADAHRVAAARAA